MRSGHASAASNGTSWHRSFGQYASAHIEPEQAASKWLRQGVPNAACQLSRRAIDNAVLTERIRTVHAASDATYGMPRVRAELIDEGVGVSLQRVARLMRAAHIRGVSRRRAFVVTTQRDKASPLVITAHRMRAHLLASATAAFCQPTRSLSAAAQPTARSDRCVCGPSSRLTWRPGSTGCAGRCQRVW